LPHDKPLKAREATAANAQMQIGTPQTKMASAGGLKKLLFFYSKICACNA
jgi:hypothetical protein